MTAQTCGEVAFDLIAQPEFFERNGHDRPSISGAMAIERYTGKRCDDELTNLKVGAMRLIGMSDRAIERECGVDRRTIPWRLAALLRTSRIPAVRERLEAITANNAEASGLVLSDLLQRCMTDKESIELAGLIKAVATAHGISVEKYQLVTGGATERLEVMVPRAGRESGEDWLKSALRVDAVDCSSTASTANTNEIVDKVEDGHTLDTPATPTEPYLAEVGGGSAPDAPPKITDASQGSKI